MTTATAMMRREALIDRFVALRPALLRHAAASLPTALERPLRAVTLHQFEALAYLLPDGLLMHDFARALEITEGSATLLAQRLIRHGLAERCADGQDLRLIRLVPTELAHTLSGRAHAFTQTLVGERLGALTDAQLLAVLEVMEQLADGPP